MAAVIAIAAAATGLLIAGHPPVDQMLPTASGGPYVATQNGLMVTLEPSAPVLRIGGILSATATVTNAGSTPTYWQPACGLLGGLRLVGPPLPAQDDGRAWSGIEGLIKLSAMGLSTMVVGFVAPNVPADAPAVCRTKLYGATIMQPGESASLTMVWRGRTDRGVPAPPGRYMVEFWFADLGRTEPEPLGPWPSQADIVVRAPLVADWPVFEGMPPGYAIDIALSDQAVAAWLDAAVTGPGFSGADIRLVDDARWVLRIDAQSPGGGGSVATARVVIDAATGAVLEREIPR